MFFSGKKSEGEKAPEQAPGEKKNEREEILLKAAVLRDVNSLLAKTGNEKELGRQIAALAAKLTLSPAGFFGLEAEKEWTIAAGHGLSGQAAGVMTALLRQLDQEGRLEPDKAFAHALPPPAEGQSGAAFRNFMAVTFTIPESADRRGVIGVGNYEEEHVYTVHRQWLLNYLSEAAKTLLAYTKVLEARSFFNQDSILALNHALEARDPDINSRRRVVNQLAMRMGQRMGLGDHDMEILNLASFLYDIGMISIPDRITLKQGPLGKDEIDIMRAHVKEGIRILTGIHSIPQEVLRIVETHHEQFDGKGYPAGLSGTQIPLASRIIHICVAYEAMTSNRPYRAGMPRASAINRLRDSSGAQFDPAVLDIFIEIVQSTKQS